MSNRVLPVVAFLGILSAVVVLVLFASQIGMTMKDGTLVDAELVLLSEGTTWTFTTTEPGVVDVLIDMPPGCTKDGQVSVSPLYVALRDDVVYEPSREPEHTLVVPHDGLRARGLKLKRGGAYVLRMEPIPMAMGNEANPARARVRVLRSLD